jgi:hypothetical protein
MGNYVYYIKTSFEVYAGRLVLSGQWDGRGYAGMSMWIGWTSHAYRISAGTPFRKRQLEILKFNTELVEIGRLIKLAQDRIQWRVSVYSVLNLVHYYIWLVAKTVEESCCSSFYTASQHFSRRSEESLEKINLNIRHGTRAECWKCPPPRIRNVNHSTSLQWIKVENGVRFLLTLESWIVA